MLAVLAVWPLAHRALVVRYDVDPWRFFGWAMYCTPKLPASIALFTIERGQRIQVPVTTLSRDGRRAVYALSRHRCLWGRLASPEAAGRALLAAHPQADSVEVEVHKLYLDPTSASIATHIETHRFD